VEEDQPVLAAVAEAPPLVAAGIGKPGSSRPPAIAGSLPPAIADLLGFLFQYLDFVARWRRPGIVILHRLISCPSCMRRAVLALERSWTSAALLRISHID
jgi:hypothetical protein